MWRWRRRGATGVASNHGDEALHLRERPTDCPCTHRVVPPLTRSGEIYVFSWSYLLAAFVSGLVLLKAATAITDLVVFNCLPGGISHVLRNKRLELVSRRSEFAEIGLKAALAASSYLQFDPDGNGSIEAEDIVRVFAKIDGVSWEKVCHYTGITRALRGRYTGVTLASLRGLVGQGAAPARCTCAAECAGCRVLIRRSGPQYSRTTGDARRRLLR